MTADSGKDHRPYAKSLEEGFERALTPFQEFISDQRSGSVLLLVCTLSALLIANSPLAHIYEALVETPAGFVLGEWSFTMSVRHWINDGLLSLFFFLLGLEIKREVLVGELKDPQQSLPIIAGSLGGMLIPTAIFLAFNSDSETIHGWGIPMATDTAFAVGVLALLGRRIPVGLFTFLTALAIVDDLGAILVLAIFYTQSLNLSLLGIAGFFLLVLVGCNALGIRRPFVYFIVGALVWLATLGSGVHATIAGVFVALTVPARPKREPRWFVHEARALIDEFEKVETQSEQPVLGNNDQHMVVERVQDTAEKATTPLRRWEHFLERPIALFVLPVFALANAGVPVDVQTLAALATDRLALGIGLGLVVGKSVGITLLTWLALRLNLGRLSRNVTMRHIAGIGLLGGMGFTMSIFIAGLGFANNPDALLTAKTAILLASLAAGVSGYLWLRLRE
ncbi:MAG: Na+/H+ antiporter NhaA [Chromatiaceae bacterium]|nr:Na+/H+ antiporter NhaA [Chromatiaceae bacterium]